nr:ClC family H(+)/Cl(-) exchange transporter [Secundilactobacillus kimchicus]
MKQEQLRQHDWSRPIAVARAAGVGILAGGVVGCFRFVIQLGLSQVQYFFGLAHQRPWLLLVWMVVGVVITLIVGRWMKQVPEIKGSGIPEVEGQLMGALDYKWWPVLWRKFAGGILGIGSGLFLGREGPTIQLGATIGQGFAASQRLAGTDRRLMIASGAAAGLAAAFNAPIASSLFVLEEVYHNFSTMVWITALTSAVCSNFVSTVLFGLKPVLYMPYGHMFGMKSYWVLILLGLFLGVLGRLYQVVLLRVGDWYAKIPGLPSQYHAIVAFLLMMPIAWWLPQTLGGGNAIIVGFNHLMPGALSLLGLFVLRFVFSMVSYGTGLPGGIFLPILTLGAILGGLFGQVMVSLHLIAPSYLPDFIIVAMAGYFAGISKAPFTAILLITEMVGTLQHLMPLAVVSLVAYLTVDGLGGAPIYEALLDRKVRPSIPGLLGATDQVEMAVFEGSSIDGLQVRQVNWPKHSLLTGVRRGGKVWVPNGDTILHAGDLIVVTVDRSQRADVYRHLQLLAQS